METIRTDLLIIGAGPAGCSLAKEAKVMDVIIVDSNTFPREKPCSGLLVEESKEILHRWGMPESVLGEPGELDLRYVDFDNNLDVLQKKALENTDRKKLDYWLLGQADNAKLLEKTLVSKIEQGNLVKVTTIKDGKENTILAKYVVGADGSTSTTRRLLGFRPAFRYRTAQHFIKTKSEITDCEFIYWNKLTDWYLWALPKEEDVIEIGGAFHQRTNTEHALEILEKKLGVEGKIIKKRNWLLSQPKKQEEMYLGNGKNIFLIGEAAGLISPSTGEGISFGLRSGIILAKALASENPFNEYEKAIQPLILEVIQKMKKANALADTKLRAALLNSITDGLH